MISPPRYECCAELPVSKQHSPGLFPRKLGCREVDQAEFGFHATSVTVSNGDSLRMLFPSQCFKAKNGRSVTPRPAELPLATEAGPDSCP